MKGGRYGKSYVAEMAKEIALDAGKRVIVVTPESMTMQRRKKHLTLIENVPKKKESVPLVIYDDDYL